MKVTQRATMPDGTEIQIEDWSGDYPTVFVPCGTIAAYPISKYTLPGSFAPKAGVRFRADFSRFETTEQVQEAFDRLVSGESTLKDYAEALWHTHHAPAL